MTCRRSEIRPWPEPAAKRSRFRRPLRGFTLIELLVVIAIISLLASILMPSLKRSRELAKRVVCSSNMRGIGLTFIMYTNDWKGYFPYIREHGPTNVTGVWADKLYDYTRNAKVFHCPSAPDRIFIPNETNGALSMAYGMQWGLGGMEMDGRPPYKIQNLTQVSRTVVLGESFGKNPGGTFYHHGYGLWRIGWPEASDSYSWGWPDDSRHSGVSNILCADSHVAPFTTEEALDNNGNLIWVVALQP